MARINLTGGDYRTPSLIGAAQQSVNLYTEYVPAAEGEPVKAITCQTPGLRFLGQFPTGEWRQLYTASNGDLYGVCDDTVYYITPQFVGRPIVGLTTSTGFVSMSDNSETLVAVDATPPSNGLSGGIQIDLGTRIATPLGDATTNFQGADFVDFLSTFLVFNEHGTPNFYASGSLAVTFDPLDFAAKATAPDSLVAPVATRGQLWLLGQTTSEVWTLSGAADFPFQQLPGALIEHGCAAVGSIAKSDGAIFFLSRDKQGRAVVLKASGYQAQRISTHALEAMFKTYIVADARAYCWQWNGHVFYVLIFPTQNITWVYDEATQLWHQWASAQGAAALNRHRSNCFAYAYDTYVVGDYANGALYALDPNTFTDNTTPIPRIRSFPHMVEDDNRIAYRRFVADMDVGTSLPADSAAVVTLTFSDDRGATFGAPLTLPLGTAGQTGLSLQFRRLGMARDRIFKLSWNAAAPIALNGAFIDVDVAAS